MRPCPRCKGPVRLGSWLVSFNRARGCMHWIEHKRTDDAKACDGTKGWEWTKWRSEKMKPNETDKMLAKWEAQP